MKEEIMEMLEEKVDQLFVELYERHGINCGDVSPMEGYQIRYLEEQLASIIDAIAWRNKNS